MRSTNKGFTLVELVVAVVISSIVMLGVVGLVTFSVRQYYRVTADSKIQLEAQVLGDFLYPALKTSKNFNQYGNVFEIEKVISIKDYETDSDLNWLYFIFDDIKDRVYLVKSATQISIEDLTYTDDNYLCSYVDEFIIEDDITSYKVTFSFSNKGVNRRLVRHVVKKG